MKNKTLVIIWVAVDLLLLVGCLFVVGHWFNTMSILKNPCAECIEKERPEIAPCILRPIPQYKINISKVFLEG